MWINCKILVHFYNMSSLDIIIIIIKTSSCIEDVIAQMCLQVFLNVLLTPVVNHKMTSFPGGGHHTKSILPVSIPTVPQLRPVLEAISRGSSPIPPEQVGFFFCSALFAA